jgi:hypothetical protein
MHLKKELADGLLPKEAIRIINREKLPDAFWRAFDAAKD